VCFGSHSLVTNGFLQARDPIAEVSPPPDVRPPHQRHVFKRMGARKDIKPMTPDGKMNPSPPLKTMLLVDDDDSSRITTKWFLTSFGYAVVSVRDVEEALAVFDPRIHDVVITDNSMPGMKGTEMAHIIKLRSPSTPVLMYTGLAPDDRSCVDVLIQKPTYLLNLKDAVDKLLAAKP
jgi:CheY-like chemotaxis protein